MDIRFVKCDVEGHEWDALQGMVGVLRYSTPACLIEVRGDMDIEGMSVFRVNQLMDSLGYQCYLLRSDQLMERRTGIRA